MTSNRFHITGPLGRESTGDRWIPVTKGKECNFFFFVHRNRLLNEQSSCQWSETPWRSCDVTVRVHAYPSQAVLAFMMRSTMAGHLGVTYEVDPTSVGIYLHRDLEQVMKTFHNAGPLCGESPRFSTQRSLTLKWNIQCGHCDEFSVTVTNIWSVK